MRASAASRSQWPSFAIDAKTGKLQHLGNGTLAHSMAYIATDRSGKFLLSASYPGHMVTVNPIGPDGLVQAVKQTLPNLPNSHAILTDKSNKHVLSPSLGSRLRHPVQVRRHDRNADAEPAGVGEDSRESRAAPFPFHQGRKVRLSAQRAGCVDLCVSL